MLFIKFIRWADESDFNNVLKSVDNAKQIVFISYSHFLDDRYSKGIGCISLRHSTSQRSIVIDFIGSFKITLMMDL